MENKKNQDKNQRPDQEKNKDLGKTTNQQGAEGTQQRGNLTGQQQPGNQDLGKQQQKPGQTQQKRGTTGEFEESGSTDITGENELDETSGLGRTGSTTQGRKEEDEDEDTSSFTKKTK